MWALWLGLAGIFVLLELHFGTFYMMLLAVSAICSMLASFLLPKFLWQGTVFVLAAFLAYLFLLPTIRKLRLFQNTPNESIDFTPKSLIGRSGIVLQEISPQTGGLVKVDSETWSAIADESIAKDSCVQILDVKVTKLYVRKADEGGI